MDTAPTKGFTKVAEMAAISKDDKPAFTKIEFTVEDYALIVPVFERPAGGHRPEPAGISVALAGQESSADRKRAAACLLC